MDKFDVIIPLGGGRNKDGSLTELSKQRLDKAITLEDKSKYILISGGFLSSYLPNAIKFDKSRAELAKNYLLAKKVSENKIISWVEECRDTLFESIIAFRKVKKLDFISVLIISSYEHLPRAKFIYEQVFGNKYRLCFESSDKGIIDSIEEKDYLNAIKVLCPDLNIAGNFEGDFDYWYKSHLTLYTKFQEIHDKYHPKGKESQAYAGVK